MAVTVKINIYTSGFRPVKQYTYTDVPEGRHDGVSYDLMGLSCGLYHVTVICTGTDGDSARMVKEPVILR
ncbi:MAG: hypothetical protein LLG37_03075 [Spirochaetia bacterium]|nr:hypothetical protein [Spirochaetia bacterium]